MQFSTGKKAVTMKTSRKTPKVRCNHPRCVGIMSTKWNINHLFCFLWPIPSLPILLKVDLPFGFSSEPSPVAALFGPPVDPPALPLVPPIALDGTSGKTRSRFRLWPGEAFVPPECGLGASPSNNWCWPLREIRRERSWTNLNLSNSSPHLIKLSSRMFFSRAGGRS